MKGEKDTVCEICSRMVRGIYGLIEHQKRVHGPAAKKWYLCPVCSKELLRSQVFMHMRIAHSPEEVERPNRLNQTRSTPDPDRPYRCQCGGLVRPSLTLIHQKTGHARRFTEGYRSPDPTNEMPERDSEASVHAWSGGLPGLGKRH